MKIYIDYYGESHPDIATTLTYIGDIWNTKVQYDKALGYYENALNIYIDYYGETHPEVASNLTRIGGIWEAKGQYDKALESFDQALKNFVSYNGESHPNVATTHFKIGDIFEIKGQYEKALEYFEQAMKTYIAYYGESHLIVAFKRNSMGLLFLRIHDYSASLFYFDSALPVFLENYGDDNRNTAALKRNRARALVGLVRYDEAEQLLIEAIHTLRDGELENDPLLARTLLRFAEWQRLTGKLDDAVITIDEALTISLINPGEQHVDTAEAYFEKALIAEAIKDKQSAGEFFQKCYDIRLTLLGIEHPDTIEVLEKLNHIY
jgi:tetratricopeptide (TPR) repeat protein